MELRDRWLNPRRWVGRRVVGSALWSDGLRATRSSKGAQEAHAEERLPRPLAVALRCVRRLDAAAAGSYGRSVDIFNERALIESLAERRRRRERNLRAARSAVRGNRSASPVSGVAAVGQAPSNSEPIRSGRPPCAGDIDRCWPSTTASVWLARSHVHTGFTERLPSAVGSDGPLDSRRMW